MKRIGLSEQSTDEEIVKYWEQRQKYIATH